MTKPSVIRSQVISEADKYVSMKELWRPLRNHDKYIFNHLENDPMHTFYSCFTSDGCYNVMPYVFAGNDNPDTFVRKIENITTCPGGWDRFTGKGVFAWRIAYGAAREAQLAGIDCSGYVLRCWGIDPSTDRYRKDRKLSWLSLPLAEKNNLEAARKKLKAGDILYYKGEHVRLFNKLDGAKFNVYEARGGGCKPDKEGGVRVFKHNDTVGCVVNRSINWNSNYKPCSIFPQFEKILPLNDNFSIPRPTFRIRVKGSGQLKCLTFHLDTRAVGKHALKQIKGPNEQPILGPNEQPILGPNKQPILGPGDNAMDLEYIPSDDLRPSSHTVSIKVTNEIAGKFFQDEFLFKFIIRNPSVQTHHNSPKFREFSI